MEVERIIILGCTITCMAMCFMTYLLNKVALSLHKDILNYWKQEKMDRP